jgi:hypothetical protein
MSDIYGSIEQSQNIIKKILGKVPGFNGYVERVNRRASDKILRETIAEGYEAQLQVISRLERDLISFGSIEYLDDLDAARLKVLRFAAKIKTASYGYSPFFDAVQVNEEELARVYQYDLQLLESTDALKRSVDNVESSIGTDGLPAAIRNLISVAEDSNTALELRDNILRGSAEQTGS